MRLVRDGEPRALRPGNDIQRPHVRVRVFNGEQHLLKVRPDGRAGQIIVVAVHHQRRALRQPLADLQLCPEDIFPRAQLLQMGAPDAGDDSARRLCRQRQLPDLAQALHSHLHHGVLHAFVQAEQRVRHADLVVLVPLCPERFAESRKYRVTELFCRRFAHAARHARQQRAVQRAVVRAQPDHRIQRVRHLHAFLRRHARHRALHHNARRSGLQRPERVIVAVHALAPDAHEQAPRPGLPAVRHHRRDLRVPCQGAQPPQQHTRQNRLHIQSSML